MEGKKWIYFFVFLTTLLQFIARADGTKALHVTVRVGDDAALTCKNVLKDQPNCSSTTWSDYRESQTEELVAYGRIRPGSKSDRLAVREDCSLVIKKVTYEDVGRYTCQQFISEKKHGIDAHVYLSVLTMTEIPSPKGLRCHVRSRHCPHRVTWFYDGDAVDQRTSQTGCYTDLNLRPGYNTSLLECKVTVGKQSQLFPFRPPSSGNKPDKGNRISARPTTGPKENTPGTTQTASEHEDSTKPHGCSGCSALDVAMFALRVAELLMVSVLTVLLFRTRGNKRPPDVYSECYDRVSYENDGEPSSSVRLH